MCTSQLRRLCKTFQVFLLIKNSISSPCPKFMYESRKAAKKNVLSRMCRFLDTPGRLAVVQSFITANFNYCPLIWHFCNRTDSLKLERLLIRALRITYSDYVSHYDQLLSKARLLTLELTRLQLLAVEIYKSKHGMSPAFIAELFSPDAHRYNTKVF